MLFDKMDGLELSLFATAFAISISRGLTKDEMALLSLFLTSVSGTIALLEKQLPAVEEEQSTAEDLATAAERTMDTETEEAGREGENTDGRRPKEPGKKDNDTSP